MVRPSPEPVKAALSWRFRTSNLRAIAVTTATRSDALPDLPTIGQVALRSDERVKVGFCLWDTAARQLILGVQHFVSSDHLHRVPHVIADTIYERLTGQVGQFDRENKD